MTDTLPYHERLRLIKLGQLPKEAVPKPKKYLKKQSDKTRIAKENERRSGEDGMDKWFEEMKEWLEGKCAFCGGKTTWKNKDLWRIAIAHLLPKSKFKSVAKNVNNWTELCWDCHTNFDSGKISWEMLFDSHEWKMLRSQLEIVLTMVDEKEKKNKLYSKLENLVYEKGGIKEHGFT